MPFLTANKMANRSYYNRFVIGKTGENYVEGMTEYGQKRVFKKRDSPKNWGMSCFAKRTTFGPAIYKSGDINRRRKKTFGELYNNELKRRKFCEDSGFGYHSIWESEWHRGIQAIRQLQRKLRLNKGPSPAEKEHTITVAEAAQRGIR